MKIDDYRSGTAFIRLYRSMFKYESDFEALLKFLKLSEDCVIIDIPVCEGNYEGR